MNANSRILNVGVGCLLGLFAASSTAVQGVDAHGQTKINSAKAKAWTDGSIKNPEYQDTVVNLGSKKKGTCNMNIGTVKDDGKHKAGDRRKTDIVVTTKDVINVCK